MTERDLLRTFLAFVAGAALCSTVVLAVSTNWRDAMHAGLLVVVLVCLYRGLSK